MRILRLPLLNNIKRETFGHSAIISPNAKIGKNVAIGAYSLIGDNVISLEIQENQTVRALVNGAYSALTGCPVSTGTVSTGQWTHLALVLYNNTWTIYINGTADGTGTGSYPSGNAHNAAYIGRTFYAADRTTEMYIEDLRISPRHARYTTNFTPPTGALEG